MSRLLVAAGLLAIVVAAVELHRACCDSTTHVPAFFDSDTLYPAAFYQDVVVDGMSWTTFKYSAATDWFPDFLIYFTVRPFTANTAQAIILCSCLFFILQLGGYIAIARKVAMPSERNARMYMALMMGALFLLLCSQSGMIDKRFRLPIVFTYHGGSLICMLYGLAIVLHLVLAPVWLARHRLGLALLGLIVMLCMASDRLLLMQFVAPAIGSLMLLCVLGFTTARRLIAISGVLIFSSIAGQQILRAIQPAWADEISQMAFTFENARGGLKLVVRKWTERTLAGEKLHLIASVWMLLSTSHVIAGIGARLLGRPVPQSQATRGMFLLSCIYMAMVASSLAAVSYAGLFYSPPSIVDVDWEEAARYFLPIYFMPFYLWGCWLTLLPTRWRKPMSIAVMSGLVVLCGTVYIQSTRVPRLDDQEVWNYYPTLTRQVDELAEQHGLRYGVCGFWESKSITLLSRRGVRVHPIAHAPYDRLRMVPFHWLSNSCWYFQGPRTDPTPPRYEFIVVKDFGVLPTPSLQDLDDIFGKPAYVSRAGAFKLAVYNRESDALFQGMAREGAHFLRETFRGRLGESIHFPARTLPASNLGPFPPDEHIAIEGCIPPGVLSGGPYLKIEQPGDYRIEIETSSSGGVPCTGTWDVILFNPQTKIVHPFHEAAIEPGERVKSSVVVTFGKRHRGRLMEARVIYNGTGMLQMHGLTITRVR